MEVKYSPFSGAGSGANKVLAIGGFGGDNAPSYDKGAAFFFCGRVVDFLCLISQ